MTLETVIIIPVSIKLGNTSIAWLKVHPLYKS